MDCLFCRIIAGETPSNKRAESENVLAFDDINPSAQTHILVIPKKHINSFAEIDDTDEKTMFDLMDTIKNLIDKFNLNDGYKVVINGGKYQHISHLHWHLLGGRLEKMPE
ncbi:MAG TPA: HIT domain-containing protein [Patescibacteria group bacterium]